MHEPQSVSACHPSQGGLLVLFVGKMCPRKQERVCFILVVLIETEILPVIFEPRDANVEERLQVSIKGKLCCRSRSIQ